MEYLVNFVGSSDTLDSVKDSCNFWSCPVGVSLLDMSTTREDCTLLLGKHPSLDNAKAIYERRGLAVMWDRRGKKAHCGPEVATIVSEQLRRDANPILWNPSTLFWPIEILMLGHP